MFQTQNTCQKNHRAALKQTQIRISRLSHMASGGQSKQDYSASVKLERRTQPKDRTNGEATENEHVSTDKDTYHVENTRENVEQSNRAERDSWIELVAEYEHVCRKRDKDHKNRQTEEHRRAEPLQDKGHGER
jgi:hypothetical protein